MNRLERIFVQVLKQCADLKAEDVLIVSDLKYDRIIVEALRSAIGKLGARPVVLMINSDALTAELVPKSDVRGKFNHSLLGYLDGFPDLSDLVFVLYRPQFEDVIGNIELVGEFDPQCLHQLIGRNRRVSRHGSVQGLPLWLECGDLSLA